MPMRQRILVVSQAFPQAAYYNPTTALKREPTCLSRKVYLLMTGWGHSRPKWRVPAMSGLPPIATELRTSLVVRFVPIVLQKSFCLTGHKFSGPQARQSNIDVGDHFILR
jgi:hypothetical protein